MDMDKKYLEWASSLEEMDKEYDVLITERVSLPLSELARRRELHQHICRLNRQIEILIQKNPEFFEYWMEIRTQEIQSKNEF